MNDTATAEAEQIHAPDGEDEQHIERIADLLRRYPRVSQDDTAQLLEFLTVSRAGTMVRLISRPGMETYLMRFRGDHPAHFKLSLGNRMLIGVLAALPAVAVLYLAVQH